MDQPTCSFGAILRQPSAFLPLTMSLTALALVLSHIAIFGAAREADEGTTAHLWQILMAGQLPVLVFFAINGCHGLQGRPCMCSGCKPEPYSPQWPPSSTSIYKSERSRSPAAKSLSSPSNHLFSLFRHRIIEIKFPKRWRSEWGRFVRIEIGTEK